MKICLEFNTKDLYEIREALRMASVHVEDERKSQAWYKLGMFIGHFAPFTIPAPQPETDTAQGQGQEGQG